MFCQQCGLKLPDGAKVCAVCGTPAGYDPGVQYRASNRNNTPAPPSAPLPAVKKKKTGLAAALISVLLVCAIAIGAYFYIKKSGSKKNGGAGAPDSGAESVSSDVDPGTVPEEADTARLLAAKIAESEVGDKVEFGSYLQDGKISPVVWIVLDRDGGSVLLCSEKILDYRAYNEDTEEPSDTDPADSADGSKKDKNDFRGLMEEALELEDGVSSEELPYVSWKESSVRRWLNGECFDAMFNGAEQGYVMECEIETADGVAGSHSRTGSPVATADRLWLLSSREYADHAEYLSSKYGAPDGEVQPEANEYFTRDQKFDPDVSEAFPGVVGEDGEVEFTSSQSDRRGIRPCVRIDVSGVPDSDGD